MIKKKTERRDKVREAAAETAADIETTIEKELLERLKMGTYGDIYNYNPKVFEKVLKNKELESENVIIITACYIFLIPYPNLNPNPRKISNWEN